ncbi:collagenase [Clostridium aceticum]|uniref:Collagenase n=1 Tax=Clostridium aceticum TaxID=84022 RepID=A0A0D8IDE4_9CLOT|nr:U32 family peptidase [Clostridium aceticum]AKL95264.1 collagenase [Clostridium aceticum]KJF28114.1 peptidase U32 [Clostridium aceticum]
MKRVELLAPAGDLERLKVAVIYGADAIYLGGEIFGLRAAAKNFTLEELQEGIKFAHERGVKVFVTANIIPHNEDLKALPQYLKEIEKVGVDAVIVSDPGTFSIVRETVPTMEVHISTQANNTNHSTVTFWHNLGAKRVVLARELSFGEIKEIRNHISDEIELEAFVHGAMCISYSGRCLLSNYMAGRDANRGECAHPCRWNYYLVEEKRPGEYMPIIEDEKGTYIMNSKDLCMIEYIPELIASGINSLKIEGRMKTAYYVATIIRAYRMAIDAYYENPTGWKCSPQWLQEIKKASHRDFTTGFYLDKPDHNEHIYGDKSYIRGYSFIGIIKAYDETTQIATVQQRNRFFSGDSIEIIGPNKEVIKTKIEKMWDEAGQEIEVAPHPKQIVKFKINHKVEHYYILRKEREEESEENK